MKDSVLNKYKAGPRAEPRPLAKRRGRLAGSLAHSAGCVGVRDRAIMLELQPAATGSIAVFGYAWLDQVEFNPFDGIPCVSPARRCRITGRNLNGEARPNVRLLSGIARHRVPWITRSGRPSGITAAKNAVVIEDIAIK